MVLDGNDYRTMPGPPIGLVVDTTPTAVATPVPSVPVEPEVPEVLAQEASTQGEVIGGVLLTTYTCVGDGTGAYCGTMASGQQVHRGAAACGYVWEFGQQFRIVGDPYQGTVYTCLDRGLGPWLWVDVWFYSYWDEGRPWRIQLPQYIEVELLP